MRSDKIRLDFVKLSVCLSHITPQVATFTFIYTILSHETDSGSQANANFKRYFIMLRTINHLIRHKKVS